MNIPIGLEYVFTVKVLEEDSFLPQDLNSLKATDGVRFSLLPESAKSASEAVIVIDSSDTSNPVGYWSKSDNGTKTITTVVSKVDNATGVVIESSTHTESSTVIINDTDNKVGTVVTSNTDITDPNFPVTTETTTTIAATRKGVLTFTLKDTSMLVPEVGAKEDGYYYKSSYKGSIVLKFTDRADMNVSISDIAAIVIG